MAKVELAPATTDDFVRLFDHLAQYAARDREARISAIFRAIDVLESNPAIGRPLAEDGLRELVIGRGARGYVALYRYLPEWDLVIVLGIRAQREKRYPNLPS